VLPEARFVESDEEAARRRYDLVLASGSLQYVENWKSAVQFLASVADGYLYITRLPVVRQGASFVAVQRMYAHGYDTECMTWVLNRDEFLDAMMSHQSQLIREFALDTHPMIKNVKEQVEIRGFLFRYKGTGEPCISE
jgi:putative methyltransferase (TIGR04325 family)